MIFTVALEIFAFVTQSLNPHTGGMPTMKHSRIHLTLLLAIGILTLGFSAKLHAQQSKNLTGPDSCTATAQLGGSGLYATGSISVSCPASHTIVTTAEVCSNGGGCSSQTNTNKATSGSSFTGIGTDGGANGTFTWSIDGVAGQSAYLTE
jgi:hypothetical protein